MRPHAAAGVGLAALLVAGIASADTLRIATFNAELTREGPGLLLRDIRGGADPQVLALVDVLTATRPDILALQGVDFDFGLETINALTGALAEAGIAYPHILALPTNRGVQTGLDMDGDGRVGDASDAQGFGRFYGQGAMALLSRYPIVRDDVQDFTGMLWADLPAAQRPQQPDGTPFPSVEAAQIQRLSSSGHWIVPIAIGADRRIEVMTFHATPPVFDGVEDRNGLRNADEIGLWTRVLDGALGRPPQGDFVIAGATTLDPFDSDGRHDTLRALLADPRLVDPGPISNGAANSPDQGHLGPNAQDTVDWDGVGRLRVDFVLPSSTLTTVASGVFWPAPGEPGHLAAITASRHRLVWVDVAITR